MAHAANEEGGLYYKQGNYAKAQKYFQEATKLDHCEVKYPANLSAALFEQGKYPLCISAIHVAWTRLKSGQGRGSTLQEQMPMYVKLATRFARAKLQGARSRALSLHPEPSKSMTASKRVAKALEEDVEGFATSYQQGDDEKVREMKTAWDQWRLLRDECAQHSKKHCRLLTSEAESRLRTLPILKSSSDPTLEFFRFGHDQVQSLLNGINGYANDPYSLDVPQYQQQTSWSLLFGGSGDGRHIFGSLIHLAFMSAINEMEGRSTLAAHMTLVDIHPTTLARVILVFSILSQIPAARLAKDTKTFLELHATLFYLYTGMLVPDYGLQIIINNCRSLVEEIGGGTSDLLQFMHINECSKEAILDALRYWSKPLQKSTKIFMDRHSSPPPFFPKPPGWVSDGTFLEPTLGEARTNSHFVRVPSGMSGPYTDPDAEYKIFRRLKVLLPPKPFLSRHPAFAQLINAFPGASDALYAETVRELEQAWVPNPTLFDQSSTEHPGLGQENGYPRISKEPFETLASFAEYSGNFHRSRAPVSSSGNSGFAVTSQFFDQAADALAQLQKSLTIEIVVGDVITGVARLVNGEFGQRPPKFPREYSRIFLSNVPDYTHGTLNTAVHLVQHLEPNQLAMANCLLNTLDFPTIADFCYNYTLLLPDALRRVLGCELINPGDNAFNDIALKRLPLPLPLEELVRRRELHTWLAHLLLCILCNGSPRHPPHRIDFPGNLNTFLHILVHLHRVGYPSHWIGDFLQYLLSDNLVTDVQPYLGRTPIPKSETANRMPFARKVHLDSWRAELEVMLALTLPALPFAVLLPTGYPSVPDILTLKAKVKPVNLMHHPFAPMWQVLISGVTKAIGLLFFNPTNCLSADFLAGHIPEILEGELPNPQIQIMLAQEHVNLLTGDISWKMGRSWYEKMKNEGWLMAAYRTDLKVAASEPVHVTVWSEI